MKHLRKIPKFKSEDQERDFWAKADATDYIDFSHARKVMLPNLKPTTRPISIRLPESLMERLKVLANRDDIPYQSLIKHYLSERVDIELEKKKHTRGNFA